MLEPTLTIAWGIGRPVSAASARPSTIVAGWRTYRRSFRLSGVGRLDLDAGVFGEASVVAMPRYTVMSRPIPASVK